MPFQLHIDEIMIVLQLLPLCKLRQLKIVNKEWRGACRRTLTSTSWLLDGKPNKKFMDSINYWEMDDTYILYLNRTGDKLVATNLNIEYDFFKGYMAKNMIDMSRLVEQQTITLPFYAMIPPNGICFSDDGYGGLKYRANIVHELSIKDGYIIHIVIETQQGIFSTLEDIFQNVIVCDPLFTEWILRSPKLNKWDDGEEDELKARVWLFHEYDNSPDSFILRYLLPCIRIGNVYVASRLALYDFFGDQGEYYVRARLVL